MVDPLLDVDCVGAQVDAERLVGALVDLVDRRDHLLERHRGGGEDAEPTRVGGTADQRAAGDPTHPGLPDRESTAEEFGCTCLQAGIDAVGHTPDPTA